MDKPDRLDKTLLHIAYLTDSVMHAAVASIYEPLRQTVGSRLTDSELIGLHHTIVQVIGQYHCTLRDENERLRAEVIRLRRQGA